MNFFFIFVLVFFIIGCLNILANVRFDPTSYRAHCSELFSNIHVCQRSSSQISAKIKFKFWITSRLWFESLTVFLNITFFLYFCHSYKNTQKEITSTFICSKSLSIQYEPSLCIGHFCQVRLSLAFEIYIPGSHKSMK